MLYLLAFASVPGNKNTATIAPITLSMTLLSMNKTIAPIAVMISPIINIFGAADPFLPLRLGNPRDVTILPRIRNM